MMSRRSLHHRRGSGMLWFVAVTLPLLLVAATLSIDLTRLYLANRAVNHATAQAAISGASDFVPGRATLSSNASNNVRNTFHRANVDGALRIATPTGTPDVAISDNNEKVTVEVEYRVDGLIFLGWVLGDPDSREVTLTATQSARVCVPGETTVTGGFCTRPQQ